jgi:predicted MPP superfamily phosphohydrolase
MLNENLAKVIRAATRRRTISITFSMVVLVLAIWGFVVEPASLLNEDYEIAVPRWPVGCDGLRLAVLADLHVGSPFNRLGKLDSIIATTERARPDLVLLAGDYVIHGVAGGQFTPPETIAASLRRLSAPLGVWAVLGNHDWWYDAPRVRSALEGVGIPVLEDTATKLTSGSCSLWLAGIGDFWEGRHDVGAALAGTTDEAAVLAFTHNPDVFPDVPERVSLTIAGHTHGGQVHVPFIGRPVVPSRFGERYAAGHVVEDGRHLFVSTGIGTSIVPVRFRVPPEISVLTIRGGTR